jgi:hypothetical protein
MEGKSNIYLIFFIFIIIGLAGFLDSPRSINNIKADSSTSIPVIAQTEGHKRESPQLPILENILVDTKVVDGYIVETYREYELYKDENGNVIKSIPTSNDDYLRYKIDE